MFRIIIIFLTTSLPIICSGQRFVIGSIADVHLKFANNWPLGQSLGNMGAVTSPVLFAGFQTSTSIDLQYTHRIRKKIGLGVSIGMTHFSSWRYPEAYTYTYTGTTARIYSFCPVASFKAPIGRNPNRFIFFISALPGIFAWDVRTSDQSEVNGNNNFFATPVESRAVRIGASLETGIDLAINSHIGISLSTAYTSISANSAIFPEKQIQYASLKAGIFLRLCGDHRYRYSEL